MFFFIIALLCFIYTGITIYRYLTTSFQLLEHLQSSAPDTWIRLGRPEKIWVRNTGGNYGGIYTIKPIWPWLNWVWQADSNGLDFRLEKELKNVSQLLKRGVICFAITLMSFFYVIVISPPA